MAYILEAEDEEDVVYTIRLVLMRILKGAIAKRTFIFSQTVKL
jgi:hypothetical protein